MGNSLCLVPWLPELAPDSLLACPDNSLAVGSRMELTLGAFEAPRNIKRAVARPPNATKPAMTYLVFIVGVSVLSFRSKKRRGHQPTPYGGTAKPLGGT